MPVFHEAHRMCLACTRIIHQVPMSSYSKKHSIMTSYSAYMFLYTTIYIILSQKPFEIMNSSVQIKYSCDFWVWIETCINITLFSAIQELSAHIHVSSISTHNDCVCLLELSTTESIYIIQLLVLFSSVPSINSFVISESNNYISLVLTEHMMMIIKPHWCEHRNNLTIWVIISLAYKWYLATTCNHAYLLL